MTIDPWDQTPLGRARRLLNAAHRREIARGVPASDQLNVDLWRATVVREIMSGPWCAWYDLTPGLSDWSPSVSRIDHANPRYTNNFVVEPWCMNRIRSAIGGPSKETTANRFYLFLANGEASPLACPNVTTSEMRELTWA